ncbi:MAG: LytTR family DNA-binding domain-containing protein [Cellvibrionaceae bacterium]|nr:LytTR family DNA-binding domain-containing protein [Cellvibrionaceae bacterium]
MDILLVDDEPLARGRLRRLLSDLNYEAISEARNADHAWELITDYDPAIVLLDIEMPGTNGLQLAQRITALDKPPAIIFTTAYDNYALDAFDTLAAAYLLKPIQREKLQQALLKAGTLTKLQLDSLDQSQQDRKQQRQHITAKGHRGVELIALEDIRYFMADQKYVQVVSLQGEVLIDETLKELETELSDRFVRVHRNALVSIQHIAGLDRDQQGHYRVRLQGIDETPLISRRYASKVKQLLNAL